ncbi:MAG: glycosyltransferase [Leptolyngbya sp. SIO4C1]|nr:glycosyltransferase [Leptolyngbya sp. SIO4C1]
MQKLSIALLTWGLKGGSLANYTLALAQGFLEAGVEKIYLVYIARGPGEGVEIPSQVELVPLEAHRSRSAPFHIAKMINRLRPDVLISVSAFVNMPATIGWLLSGVRSTKLIVSQHSTMSYKAYVELKHDVKFRFQPLMARLLYPRASAVHANSQHVLDDLLYKIKIGVPTTRAFATANPVDAVRIRHHAQAPPTHPWLKTKEMPVILSVGRLAKQKNYPLLVEAFAKLRNQQPARLVILGEGPERQTLEQQIRALNIKNWVSLPGFVSNPWAEMANADVFALSSEEEPFGLVLVEAMACDLPIVSTHALGNGPQAVLGDGKYGRLISNADAQCLASHLASILSDTALRSELIQLGRKRCEDFEPQKIAQTWLSFIDKNIIDKNIL